MHEYSDGYISQLLNGRKGDRIANYLLVNEHVDDVLSKSKYFSKRMFHNGGADGYYGEIPERRSIRDVIGDRLSSLS